MYSFVGYESYFEGLLEHRDSISGRLLQNVSAQWMDVVENHEPIDVALHVRRGDFAANWQSSTDWFVQSLSQVQSILGANVRCAVFSDSPPESLGPLLQMPNTIYVSSGAAISDMLLMSRARVLIASCHSTFSAWASFLGGMPTLVDSVYPFRQFRLAIPEYPVYEFIRDHTSQQEVQKWLMGVNSEIHVVQSYSSQARS